MVEGRRRKREEVEDDKGKSVHCDIYVLHRHLAVDFLHCLSGVLHCGERLLIYVRGFNGVYLLLEHVDLAICLLQGVLMLLLPFQSISCS